MKGRYFKALCLDERFYYCGGNILHDRSPIKYKRPQLLLIFFFYGAK